MATNEGASTELPRPFFRDGWSSRERGAATALWRWHLALYEPKTPTDDDELLDAYFDAERRHAEAGEPVALVDEATWTAAYAACEAHRLPRALLARQVAGARFLVGGITFGDAQDLNDFLDLWPRPHGQLLAHLGGASGSWQLRYVDELATGFFWVGRLMNLKHDTRRGWFFIPRADMAQAEVSPADLMEGNVTEGMRRLLWKEAVRARDAFAQGEPLVKELARRQRSALKRWWLGALEVLNEIDRRDYDVWAKPISLSPYHRLQARFQARFGRTTFRSR